MKQSSIEWLAWKFATTDIEEFKDNFNEYVNQAKQMHKQEIIEAYEKISMDTPEEFYKNTYEKEN